MIGSPPARLVPARSRGIAPAGFARLLARSCFRPSFLPRANREPWRSSHGQSARHALIIIIIIININIIIIRADGVSTRAAERLAPARSPSPRGPGARKRPALMNRFRAIGSGGCFRDGLFPQADREPVRDAALAGPTSPPPLRRRSPPSSLSSSSSSLLFA